MDFALANTADAELDLVLHEPIQMAESKPATRLAQGISCGSVSLAFTYDWARQITDEFDITPIPNAPAWLLGMTNIEGNILPIVDLALYFDILTAQNQFDKPRLLIGSLQSGQDNDALALIFAGLPQQLNYLPRPVAANMLLPPKLQELCTGMGVDKSGKDYFEINASSLMLALSNEISQI